MHKKILFTKHNHKCNNLSDKFKLSIIKAQYSNFNNQFATIDSFISQVCHQLKINLVVNIDNDNYQSPNDFADKSFKEFINFFVELLKKNNYPEQSIYSIAVSLASRAMLLRAFEDPDFVISYIEDKIIKTIDTFPKKKSDIECGRKKGDVLDPFILSATQYLLYPEDFDGAIFATVSHKVLMITEALLGHLHEDVIGMMRGNIRVPEPRGKDKEIFDYINNPFPGADVIQPPHFKNDCFKIFQIKSKTGSTKGGDGKRLGDQLQFLSEMYEADIFYAALIGNTLIGHRSKSGVEKAAPKVRIVVGQMAFFFLTGSKHGANLLLRLYHEAFTSAAQKTGYSLIEISKSISESFRLRADKEAEDFFESILNISIGGDISKQDSFVFNKK